MDRESDERVETITLAGAESRSFVINAPESCVITLAGSINSLSAAPCRILLQLQFVTK